jgi:uncharacterized protein (TIGR03437 family)
MRWEIWVLAAGLPVAAVHGQTCPAVSFLQGSSVTGVDNLHASGLQRQPDGSLTRWRYQRYSPYFLDDSTPDYQSAFWNCSAAGARTFKNPPGWVALANRPGTPTQTRVIADLLGNGTPVGVAIVNPNFDGSPSTAPSLAVAVPNPDGSVKSKNFYAVPSSPGGLLVADFNHDGKEDVVVLGYGSNGAWTNTIAVYLGNGDGTLRPPAFYSGDEGTDAAVAYDFNGDNNLDLAVVNAVSGDVSILLGHGDGTFAAPVNYPAAKGAMFIAGGDFNGDGRADVVVGGANFLCILLGNGNGAFNSAINMKEPFSVSGMAVGDFNNDGKLDLAVSDSTDGVISVLLGDGTGKFSTEYDYLAGYEPGNLFAMDLDGDGNLDVVLASGHPDVLMPNATSTTITAFFGRGDGSLIGPPAYWTGSGVNALAVADFNGDGKPDIAVASGELWILMSSGNGAFKTPVPIALGSGVSASGIAAADFNRDGKQDLVVGDFNGSGVYVLLGNGDGTFQSPVKYAVGGNITAVAVADFNGDGKPDIAVCGSYYSPEGANVGVLLGIGDGTFRPVSNLSGFGSVPVSLTVGDFNNDGKPDLAVVDQGTYFTNPLPGGVVVYLGKGDGTFQNPVNYTAGTNPLFVVAADVNGDHALDLIVGTDNPDYNTNFQSDVAVLLGNGNGTFQPALYTPTEEAPGSIAVADFNGDGKPDLAITHCCAETYATYMLGNGDGSFQPEVEILSANSPSTIAAADLIGNGKPDLIVGSAEYNESSVSILQNLAALPTITAVVNGASFQYGIVPGSWITILGTDLSSTTDTWANAIVNGNLPTGLDGVGVSVGGLPAYIDYISPTQINAIAPNVGTGTAPVTVTNSSVTSLAVAAVSQTAQPAFFQWGNYAVATRQDYSLAVKNGAISGVTTVPAKPGDVIILWGTGFGPTSPAAPVGAEAPLSPTYYTANQVTVTVGSAAATVYGVALAPGYAGLYQVAIQIPTSLANGDYPVVATVSGQGSPSTTLITVQK